MYIYHYYAMKQISPGSVKHMDGLMALESKLSGDWELYLKLKDEIETANGEKPSGTLTICSLTLLSS